MLPYYYIGAYVFFEPHERNSVIVAVSDRHTMKSQQPLLEPVVIGIDILDVICTPHPDAPRQVHRMVFQTQMAGHKKGIGKVFNRPP